MKTVSYCLYGDKPHYIEGAYENAISVRAMYRDWVAKFYIHKDVDPQVPYNLMTLGAEIEICDIPHMKMARFLELFNDNIAIFRDTDSIITDREVGLVERWLMTGRKFHCMRDHRYHLIDDSVGQHWPVLAGMWGKRGKVYDEILVSLTEAMFDESLNNPDQDWIRDNLFSKFEFNFAVHDYSQDIYMMKNRREETHIGRREFTDE